MNKQIIIITTDGYYKFGLKVFEIDVNKTLSIVAKAKEVFYSEENNNLQLFESLELIIFDNLSKSGINYEVLNVILA